MSSCFYGFLAMNQAQSLKYLELLGQRKTEVFLVWIKIKTASGKTMVASPRERIPEEKTQRRFPNSIYLPLWLPPESHISGTG